MVELRDQINCEGGEFCGKCQWLTTTKSLQGSTIHATANCGRIFDKFVGKCSLDTVTSIKDGLLIVDAKRSPSCLKREIKLVAMTDTGKIDPNSTDVQTVPVLDSEVIIQNAVKSIMQKLFVSCPSMEGNWKALFYTKRQSIEKELMVVLSQALIGGVVHLGENFGMYMHTLPGGIYLTREPVIGSSALPYVKGGVIQLETRDYYNKTTEINQPVRVFHQNKHMRGKKK